MLIFLHSTVVNYKSSMRSEIDDCKPALPRIWTCAHVYGLPITLTKITVALNLVIWRIQRTCYCSHSRMVYCVFGNPVIYCHRTHNFW
jgi:hypothetical protein